LVYGLENCVDFLSSVVVLWRFFAASSVDEALERKLQHREQRADVAISGIISLLGFGIIISAIEDFTRGAETQTELAAVVVISFFSIWFFSVLACLKFRYAVRLNSPSLKKDGICSLIGTIMAVALFINTLIIAQKEEAWWIDPVVAILVGLFAFFYGILCVRSASKKGMPIGSWDWWRGKKEDEDALPSPRNSPNVELPPIEPVTDGEHDVV